MHAPPDTADLTESEAAAEIAALAAQVEAADTAYHA